MLGNCRICGSRIMPGDIICARCISEKNSGMPLHRKILIYMLILVLLAAGILFFIKYKNLFPFPFFLCNNINLKKSY